MNTSPVICPSWAYFPRNTRPPQWATDLVAAVQSRQSVIDTGPLRAEDSQRLTIDTVLAHLREPIGYLVESGKGAGQRIRQPVLFADNGEPEVAYEIDAFHDEHGIAVEVEAGRGAKGNADYRDIVRTSLLLDSRFFVLMMPLVYRFDVRGKPHEVAAYSASRSQLSAIYAPQRLRLPFEGVLLIGY